jgi:hypothetical protein
MRRNTAALQNMADMLDSISFWSACADFNFQSIVPSPQQV